MEILLVHPGPPLSQHDVWAGWRKALRKLGHEVTDFRTDKLLLSAGKWPPDEATVGNMREKLQIRVKNASFSLVLGIGTSFLTPEVIRASRVPVVLLHTESPYEDARQLELAPFADVNLVNDTLNLAQYEAVGRPALYVPHSYDPEVHYPSNGEKFVDLAFIGTKLPSRAKFFAEMDCSGLRACIDGGGFSPNGVPNEHAALLYRSSKAGINIYRREGDTDKGQSAGPREVEMAACGLFFLRESRDESNMLFDHMLPVFESPAHARELLDFWLARPGLRALRAEMARDAVKDRTFLNQACRVIDYVKEIL